jgi:CRP-like cAMP-binding protein
VSHPQIKIQSFLANLPLFRELGPQEIERIAAGSRTFHAARGETLFHKGDRVDGFHTIVFGQIKLAFTAPSGGEKVVELLGPNQTFGEAVMFMERPYPVYAQALADSLLLHVSKSVVFEEIERDPKFARKMIGGLSRRLHGLVTDLEAYTLHSGTQRVLGYLLRGMPEGEPESEPVEISLSTSKSILASRLNLTPEHFSRILHDLTEAGLIRVEGRSIRILDPEALRRYEGRFRET